MQNAQVPTGSAIVKLNDGEKKVAHVTDVNKVIDLAQQYKVSCQVDDVKSSDAGWLSMILPWIVIGVIMMFMFGMISRASGGGGGGSVTTKYTLSFDTNGGSAIAKVTKEKGTTVDLGQYVPTREGYTFAGWYSDEALTQKVTSVKLNANTTVYAKWTENAVTPTLPFTDVKSGDWFYEAVQYVYDKGMMTGVSADRFAPASTTTRGMIVTILYRLENEPEVSGGSAFTDVENGAWYADAVAWAAANDIVNGTSATTFAPNSPITREQMAAILYRYAAYKGYDVSQKADLSGYTDAASISGYAKDALAWANAQKLITGVTDTTLNPQGSATRAQVAAILMRYQQSIGA